jgi:hypothetical protein
MDDTKKSSRGDLDERDLIKIAPSILPNKFGFVNRQAISAERGAAYLDERIEAAGAKYAADEIEAYCSAALKKLADPDEHERTSKHVNVTEVVIATPPIVNKKYPAFGRQIAALRQAGKIPRSIVYIVSDWMLARQSTRIVLDRTFPVNQYRFDFLAGLPLQICCEATDSKRVSELTAELRAVNPSWLATFCPDLIGTNWPARCILVNELSSKEVAA